MNIEKLLKKINIKFKSIDLYIQSLTHSTFSNELSEKVKNYESLEFLGDSLINFTVTEYVYKNLDDLVGKLSSIKNFLISNDLLSDVVKKLGILKFLRLGKSLKKIDLDKENSKILADIFESFVAAIYLDSNDFEYTKKFIIKNLIKPNWDKSLVSIDFKTILQEYIQKKDKNLSDNLYNFIEKENLFFVTCKYKGFITKVSNINKKKAQKEAAKLMLVKLKLL